MRYLTLSLSVFILFTVMESYAQERGDYTYVEYQEEGVYPDLSGVDTSLFRIHSSYLSDSYSDALRYYRLPVAWRRRGLYYTTLEEILLDEEPYSKSYIAPVPSSSVALYGANHSYNMGLRASVSELYGDEWSLGATLWAQSGRSQFIEGVFSNYILPEVRLDRHFGGEHLLSLVARCDYKMRGLQLSSTQEAFTLTGDNLYNPTWGYYNGEVRNSRVRRELIPSLDLSYQLPLTNETLLIVESSAQYEREANSALGWYDATTPMPDYYSKMPSYMTYGTIRDYVTDLWCTADPQYTQVNWDALVEVLPGERCG